MTGSTSNGERATGHSVFVVVPAYNEGPRLAENLRSLLATHWSIVVVDDGSNDDTHLVATRCGAKVLRHLLNRGQGAALQTGINWALSQGADVIVTFDADGQHRVEDLAALVAPILRRSHDYALGSRFLGRAEGIPRGRRLILAGAVLFTRLASGLPVTDAHNGLRALSRRGAERIDLTLDRMAHASEILDQIRTSSLPWIEVPVAIRYTGETLAKGQRGSAVLKILFDYLVSRWLR